MKPKKVRPCIFFGAQSKNAIFALLHFPNTEIVFEKWRYVLYRDPRHVLREQV